MKMSLCKLEVKDMVNILDWGYDKALNGLPGMGTAEELARDYLTKKGTRDEQIDSLIRWQATKCGTSGFLTGLGGLITLPVAIPANISSSLYVQMRMIAAIAYMHGYDIRDDKVKTFVFTCLCGNEVKDILKQAGCQVGEKITKQLIQKIPGPLLTKINQIVGFRLITKFGTTGVINLGKFIPGFSGIINGAMDAYYTTLVGNKAKELFTDISIAESTDDYIDIASEAINQ